MTNGGTSAQIGPVAELAITKALIRLGKANDFFDHILRYIPEYRKE
jgi:hypothetical protein